MASAAGSTWCCAPWPCAWVCRLPAACGGTVARPRFEHRQHGAQCRSQRLDLAGTEAARQLALVERQHAASMLEGGDAGARESHQPAASIGRIRDLLDEAAGGEIRQRLSHRLLAHLDAPRQLTGPHAVDGEMRQQAHQRRGEHTRPGLAIHLGLRDLVEQARALEEQRTKTGADGGRAAGHAGILSRPGQLVKVS